MIKRIYTNVASAVAGAFGALAIWRGTNHQWAWMVADVCLCLGFGVIAILRLGKEKP